MRKSILKKVVFLFICLLVVSCSSDDSNPGPTSSNSLVGTWNVSAIRVVSALGTEDASVSGTITFNSNNSGKENYTWTAFGLTVSENAPFSWVSTSTKVNIDFGTGNETIWAREVNEASMQKATFEATENGVSYTITMTLTK